MTSGVHNYRVTAANRAQYGTGAGESQYLNKGSTIDIVEADKRNFKTEQARLLTEQGAV